MTLNPSVDPPAASDKPRGRGLSRGIKAIALILILVSIGLRATNLDLKPFWEDEVDTMVHVSGYQRQTIAKQLDQQRLTVGDLAKYRDPQSGQSWLETLRALTTTAEQPPLYFVILRAWSVIFGHSVAALRSMSVVFSVLGLGVFYLLGRSLFPTDSATGDAAGWGSMTLAALSPVLLRYAQETRAYSLWVLWLGLSTWLLLRTWRSPSKRNWSIYGITLILAFHTHLLTLFVIVGHGMALIIHGILNRWRQTPLKGWILTVVASGVWMIPWLAVLLSKQGSIQTRAKWLSTSRPLDSLIRAWTVGFSKTWLDLPGQQALFWSVISLVGFIGVAIATVYLWRHSQRDSIVTILSLTLVPALMILAMDILSGGQRSTVHRYFIPAYIGLLTLCG
ncbi:MAG: glycosyltransferase family 39 protein, partial [Cyanobacteria bacterium P01_H01_bin.130]